MKVGQRITLADAENKAAAALKKQSAHCAEELQRILVETDGVADKELLALKPAEFAWVDFAQNNSGWMKRRRITRAVVLFAVMLAGFAMYAILFYLNAKQGAVLMSIGSIVAVTALTWAFVSDFLDENAVRAKIDEDGRKVHFVKKKRLIEFLHYVQKQA